MKEPIGLLGLGLLGHALGRRLLSAGFTVTGFDINPSRCELFRESGGQTVASADQLFANHQRIILCLLHSDQVRSALDEVTIRPETILFDTTTGRPEDAISFAAGLKKIGSTYLDTTVVGSSQQVEAGEATLLVGGDAAVVKHEMEFLQQLAPQVFSLGQNGSAAKMKLVVNLCIGLHRAVLAEALTLADLFSLDLEQTLQILQATPAASAAMQVKGPKMLQQDFTPQAKLAQHLKDVRLMLESAEKHDATLPLSEIHASLLQNLVQQGWGDLDNSAIIKAYQPDADKQD
ncbi:MAG: NAD(P)-dependent oxidoreductase [Planctomycetales bacterium]|nr:NAD(P)-dependent oxidoreductase [Planctomycetales bacterium]